MMTAAGRPQGGDAEGRVRGGGAGERRRGIEAVTPIRAGERSVERLHGSAEAEARGHKRAALDAHSVREAYRRWAGVYDTVFGGVSAFGRRRAVAAVNRLPGPRVLEVGVGTGLALPHYRRDLRVVGIDLSREMLERAQQRVAEEGLTHVTGLLEMDAEHMAFRDDSFDVAVAMFTASVVPDAKRLFAEMSRVVRPGGQLLFVNHFAAEAGPRWWVERAMAPLARVLGWHPDFALRNLLDPERAKIEGIEPCPPAGLFTLVRVRNDDALPFAIAAE